MTPERFQQIEELYHTTVTEMRPGEQFSARFEREAALRLRH